MKKEIINENSTISVRRMMGKGIDQHGREVIKVKWFELTEPLNLGSMAKPKNTDLDLIKIEVPRDRSNNPLGDIFKGMFGD